MCSQQAGDPGELAGLRSDSEFAGGGDRCPSWKQSGKERILSYSTFYSIQASTDWRRPTYIGLGGRFVRSWGTSVPVSSVFLPALAIIHCPTVANLMGTKCHGGTWIRISLIANELVCFVFIYFLHSCPTFRLLFLWVACSPPLPIFLLCSCLFLIDLQEFLVCPNQELLVCFQDGRCLLTCHLSAGLFVVTSVEQASFLLT